MRTISPDAPARIYTKTTWNSARARRLDCRPPAAEPNIYGGVGWQYDCTEYYYYNNVSPPAPCATPPGYADPCDNEGPVTYQEAVYRGRRGFIVYRKDSKYCRNNQLRTTDGMPVMTINSDGRIGPGKLYAYYSPWTTNEIDKTYSISGLRKL